MFLKSNLLAKIIIKDEEMLWYMSLECLLEKNMSLLDVSYYYLMHDGLIQKIPVSDFHNLIRTWKSKNVRSEICMSCIWTTYIIFCSSILSFTIFIYRNIFFHIASPSFSHIYYTGLMQILLITRHYLNTLRFKNLTNRVN